MPRLDDVSGADGDATVRQAIAIALRQATGRRSIAADSISLMDDDLDGRAERLRIDLEPPVERWKAVGLLEPTAALAVGRAELARALHPRGGDMPRVRIDCSLKLDAVEWAGKPDGDAAALLSDPVCDRLVEASAMPIMATGGQRRAMVFFWPADAEGVA